MLFVMRGTNEIMKANGLLVLCKVLKTKYPSVYLRRTNSYGQNVS